MWKQHSFFITSLGKFILGFHQICNTHIFCSSHHKILFVKKSQNKVRVILHWSGKKISKCEKKTVLPPCHYALLCIVFLPLCVECGYRAPSISLFQYFPSLINHLLTWYYKYMNNNVVVSYILTQPITDYYIHYKSWQIGNLKFF